MTNTTDTGYAHTVARLANVDAVHLEGLDAMDLDVLYFGILADDASRRFRDSVNYLDTAVLELYAARGSHSPAERAYCDLLLARRANRDRYAR